LQDVFAFYKINYIFLWKGDFMNEIKTVSLFDLSKSIAGEFLSKYEYPWEALKDIESIIISIGATLPSDKYFSPSENIWIANDVSVPHTAVIQSPAIIESGTEIRTGAFIRGRVIIGEGCVIGNSCEIKNSIIFNNAQVPHFNYIGDSILGYKSHTGAGAITSNVKSDKTPVCIKAGQTKIETGLKKVGAMIGDHVEIGCNSVLNPGTVIGRNTTVYPLSCVRGAVPQNSIYKSEGNTVPKKEI
jgi:NDP-sugar pyrophosphorylase family protein